MNTRLLSLAKIFLAKTLRRKSIFKYNSSRLSAFARTTILLLAIPFVSNAQTLTMEDAVQFALKNNLQVAAGKYEIEQYQQLKKTYVDLGKTNVMWMHGNYNSVN